jgi:hypothetical protein
VSNAESNHVLQLSSSEEMLMSAYRVIDILLEHFEQLREKPVTHKAN